MNSKIITVFSPKTAGASSVALNLAVLHSSEQPNTAVALVELARWGSQGVCFSVSNTQNWGMLPPFLGGSEWDGKLLEKVRFEFGADVYWAPGKFDSAVFSLEFLIDFLDLLQQKYAVIYFDLGPNVPSDWQNFLFEKSDRVLGVVTPDPVNLAAWEQWQNEFLFPEKLGWWLNQVSSKRADQQALLQKFSDSQVPLLGVLPHTDLFWSQVYQGFPVVSHRRSDFKKSLLQGLPHLLSCRS